MSTQQESRLRIVVAHGECRSLWYVVDGAASIEEQPVVLTTCHSQEEARHFIENFKITQRSKMEGGDEDVS